MAAYRVFLSAASSEFAELRRAVWFQLWFSGWTVIWHEELHYGRETLLSDLEQEIESTDHTVCLVGHLSGRGFPQVNEATPYARLVPEPGSRASYTQWECLFAHAKVTADPRRRLVIFRTPDLKDGEAGPEASGGDDPDLQARFRRWLHSTGIARLPFHSPDDLLGQVRRQLPPVPYPDGQVVGTGLPTSIDDRFIGRDAFMERLYKTLQAGNGAAVIAAIAGMSGVGKTRVAVEYARARRQDYPAALLMIGAATTESLETNLAALTADLGLSGPDALSRDQQRDAVERWLKAHPGWLLILDHVDTQDGLDAAARLIGRVGGHGHVLVTSRRTTMPHGLRALDLGVLAPADAARFLLDTTAGRRAAAQDDPVQAQGLAGELGFLALALTHASAYLVVHGIGIAAYRARLAAAFERVLGFRDPGVEEQVVSTWATLEMSLDRVSAGSRALLEWLAFLADEPVPRSLLEVSVPGVEREEVEAAEIELASYSLLTRNMEAGTFTTHRLVRDLVRGRLSPEAAHARLEQALGWVDAAFEGHPQDARTWPRLLPLAEHGEHVALAAERAGIDAPTGRLMGQLGTLFDARAQYGRAERLKRAALAIEERRLGPDHPEVATDLNNLAELLRVTNRLSEAEPLYRRALAIGEASLGPDHPDVATDLNNLAGLLYATNRLSEAEPLYRRALAIDEASLGPDHPIVATNLNNLAELLHATNRLSEAEPLYRRALAIHEASYGPDHPEVATDLNNLAGLLRETNRLSDAEPLYRRALAIDEASLGPDHPNVARDLNNLAELLRATNRLSEAEPLFRRALAIDEASLGPDHPDVATGLNNLAGLLHATNRLSEAEPLLSRALAIDEASLGPDHPSVARDLNNLAELLHDTNRLSEAEPLYRRALAITGASLGPDHPKVAAGLNNLAMLLHATNRLAEAEPLSRRMVLIFLKFQAATGHAHPHRDAALANYAGILEALGRTRAEIIAELRALLAEAGLDRL